MSTRPSTFRITDQTRADLNWLAEQTGKTRTELISEAIAQAIKASQPSQTHQLTDLPTTQNPPNPLDTHIGQPLPPLPADTLVDVKSDVGQLWTQPSTAWNPELLLVAKTQADQGNMEMCSDLWESMLADDRITTALDSRILASEYLPVQFIGSPRGAKRLSEIWPNLVSPALRADLFRWGMGVGVVPVYVRSWEEGQPTALEIWHPRWLRYFWWERKWKILTLNGLIDMDSQPGRWYLFCPFGQPLARPWLTGFWYSAAVWWLAKSFAIPDLANFGQQHSSPKWFMTVQDGNATISSATRQEAIRWLSRIPSRASMYVPYPFKVEQYETNSSAWQSYLQEIDKANGALARRIIGHDGSMEKTSSHASGMTALEVRLDLIRYDVDAEREFWRQGLLKTWAEVNAIAGPVPYPDRDTTPPEDLKTAAATQMSVASAVSALTSSGVSELLDMPTYLGRYFPLKGGAGSGIGAITQMFNDRGDSDTRVVRLNPTDPHKMMILKDSSSEPKDPDIRKGARQSWSAADELIETSLEQKAAQAPGAVILRILSQATGYDDARERLKTAFPELQSRDLMDVISGGTLLSQAAGRLYAGREAGFKK